MAARHSLVTLLCVCGCLLAPDPAEGSEVPRHENGAMLELELPGPGAAAYGAEQTIALADRHLARELQRRHPELRFSSRLARAAEAYSSSLDGDSPTSLPVPFLEHALWWAGSTVTDAVVSVVATSEDSDLDLWSQFSRVLHLHQSGGLTHAGIGRVAMSSSRLKWRWTIILARERVSLAALRRVIAPEQPLGLRFTMSRDDGRPEVVLLTPNGALSRHWPNHSNGVWSLEQPPSGETGQAWIEILDRGSSGPSVAALFPIYFGVQPPTSWQGRRPPDEGWISGTEDAEQLMLLLINETRRQQALRPFQSDPRLAAIAREHSRTMVASGFLGHLAPDGSDHEARIRRAGYRASRTAENIARAATVYDAHTSLLRSPVHRVNLLSPHFRRIGIGITFGRNSRGERVVYVTQEFAEPLS